SVIGAAASPRRMKRSGALAPCPKPLDERAAWLRQDDAGSRRPLHPAANDRAGIAGSDEDLQCARAAAAGDTAAAGAPLPRSASHHELCRVGRWRVVAA